MNEIFKFLPTIATVLGSPLAGLAVEAIGTALGLTEPTKEAVVDVLQSGTMTTAQITSLKHVEADLKVKLQELDIKLEDLRVEDRKSARLLFAQGKALIGGIAIITIAGFYASIYWVFHAGLQDLDPQEIIMVGTVIGYLAANTQQVYSYFFGSSSGSDKKNDMLQQAIAK